MAATSPVDSVVAQTLTDELIAHGATELKALVALRRKARKRILHTTSNDAK